MLNDLAGLPGPVRASARSIFGAICGKDSTYPRVTAAAAAREQPVCRSRLRWSKPVCRSRLRWSLLASKGPGGVISVEQGGLVADGRWYGMCPGTPNPAEFELLDAGRVGLVYGYVANRARTRFACPLRFLIRRCSGSGAGRSSSARRRARPARRARSCSTPSTAASTTCTSSITVSLAGRTGSSRSPAGRTPGEPAGIG